mmetsp:Transcript_3736/g.13828  ORF Transcript_3736/g.13828 Transcript_3736/m.13828 type:complete len:444 (-) Transcript_3736:215-1546(-)
MRSRGVTEVLLFWREVVLFFSALDALSPDPGVCPPTPHGAGVSTSAMLMRFGVLLTGGFVGVCFLSDSGKNALRAAGVGASTEAKAFSFSRKDPLRSKNGGDPFGETFKTTGTFAFVLGVASAAASFRNADFSAPFAITGEARGEGVGEASTPIVTILATGVSVAVAAGTGLPAVHFVQLVSVECLWPIGESSLFAGIGSNRAKLAETPSSSSVSVSDSRVSPDSSPGDFSNSSGDESNAFAAAFTAARKMGDCENNSSSSSTSSNSSLSPVSSKSEFRRHAEGGVVELVPPSFPNVLGGFTRTARASLRMNSATAGPFALAAPTANARHTDDTNAAASSRDAFASRGSHPFRNAKHATLRTHTPGWNTCVTRVTDLCNSVYPLESTPNTYVTTARRALSGTSFSSFSGDCFSVVAAPRRAARASFADFVARSAVSRASSSFK